ncbi:Cell wall-associated hydrolases [hydrothermal vent metagenome]|uniref:Cell wall-associated hydrolases n=1 Tax=hydrothermal vent metagenome TaxID=652676 RepID=A0A1W1EFJ5_9ZZZZ
MKIILPILFISLFMFSGCAKKYSYPNYEIIKPTTKCKPNRKNIQKLLDQHLNKPYVWAEEGPDAFDCSGLTYNIYGEMGVELPRVARDQAKVGKKIAFKDLIYGDLIFFGSTNKRSKRITHVGIYLGNGWFAHASSQQRKVTYTHFKEEPKYFKRIKICRRYMSPNEKNLYLECHSTLKKLKTTSTTWTTPWKAGMSLPKKAVP